MPGHRSLNLAQAVILVAYEWSKGENLASPSVTEIADSTSALVRGTPRGEATCLRESRTCCCVTLTRASPEALSVLIENRALLSCVDALS